MNSDSFELNRMGRNLFKKRLVPVKLNGAFTHAESLCLKKTQQGRNRQFSIFN